MSHLIGWHEWVSLPDLGISALKCKVDTGAKNSALHAFEVIPFHNDLGEPWVRFSVHTDENDLTKIQVCEAKIIDERPVTDSGGNTTNRFFIKTRLHIGKKSYSIQISITNRDTMKFKMLLGRTALRKGHFLVDPGQSYLQGHRP